MKSVSIYQIIIEKGICGKMEDWAVFQICQMENSVNCYDYKILLSINLTL